MKSLRFCVALTATVVIVTGCGASPVKDTETADSSDIEAAESYYDEVNALTGQERRDRLVRDAVAEGELRFYTTLTEGVASVVEKEFEADFDIEVEMYRAEGSSVLQRLLQEYSAGRQSADVIEISAMELLALNEQGILAEYASERREMVAPEGQQENWTATRFNVRAPSWNTDKVSPGDVPTSWEDLADPKWDGRIGLELTAFDWYMTLYRYWQDQGKTDAEIDGLFADIVDGAEVQKGLSTMMDLMAAGKFDLDVTNYTYIAAQQRSDGAPLDNAPLMEPVISRPNGVGLIRNTEHPAAAMLFTDWILEEGQTLLYDLQLTPAIVPKGKPDPLKGVDVVPVDMDELATESGKWEDAYIDLLKK